MVPKPEAAHAGTPSLSAHASAAPSVLISSSPAESIAASATVIGSSGRKHCLPSFIHPSQTPRVYAAPMYGLAEAGISPSSANTVTSHAGRSFMPAAVIAMTRNSERLTVCDG